MPLRRRMTAPPPPQTGEGKTTSARGERLDELAQGHFALLAAVEVLHLDDALGQLVVADDDGGAGVELVGPLHATFHVAAIVLLDGDARPAKRPRDAQGLGLGGG